MFVLFFIGLGPAVAGWEKHLCPVEPGGEMGAVPRMCFAHIYIAMSRSCNCLQAVLFHLIIGVKL